jgi:hypothetical protein
MTRIRQFLLTVAVLAVIDQTSSRAEIANWSAPALDTWTYPAADNPGTRTEAPTFMTDPGLDENGAFFPGTARDPSRRGMMIAAFDSSEQIDAGYSPSRYSISSVTVTFTQEHGTVDYLKYRDTAVTSAEVMADYLANTYNSPRPMELYGVGFQAGHVGFDLGGGDPEGELFSEDEYPYLPGGANGVLVAYPVSNDASGSLVDISNSLTGGYSATELDNNTEPFDAVPWAIGKNSSLTLGRTIPVNTTFSFVLNLQLPGVAEYVQQALSAGSLGFVLSSLHFPGDPHSGQSLPYPQWYTKDYPSSAGGIAPTLSIDYEIVSLPGDLDNDGDVDTDDLEEWQLGYGTEYNGRDFLTWQRHYTGSQTLSVVSVPEPASLSLVGACVVAISFRRGSICRRGLVR